MPSTDNVIAIQTGSGAAGDTISYQMIKTKDVDTLVANAAKDPNLANKYKKALDIKTTQQAPEGFINNLLKNPFVSQFMNLLNPNVPSPT